MTPSIEPLRSAGDVASEKEAWDREFDDNDYQDVYSVTESTSLVETLVESIDDEARTVLVPGCGAKTHLQERLVAERKEVEVVCTDFSEPALEMAEDRFRHDRVRYVRRPTEDLDGFEAGAFDTAVVVNSILSGDHDANQAQLEEIGRVLGDGGQLVGLFPTILCAFELFHTLLPEGYKRWEEDQIDVENNLFLGPDGEMGKAYYTPNRLNLRLEQAGLTRETMEICFFDDDHFQEETERLHGIPPELGVYIWELLVRARA